MQKQADNRRWKVSRGSMSQMRPHPEIYLVKVHSVLLLSPPSLSLSVGSFCTFAELASAWLSARVFSTSIGSDVSLKSTVN